MKTTTKYIDPADIVPVVQLSPVRKSRQQEQALEKYVPLDTIHRCSAFYFPKIPKF